MASTVIRVKRRITDEPFDTFILNCKRFKSANESENDQNGAKTEDTEQVNIKNTIAKLAATFNNEDDIKTHLTKLRKGEAEEIVHKTRKPNRIINKLRDQFKENVQNHRFKVVNFFRSVGNDLDEMKSTNGEQEEQEITIVDVIKEVSQTKSKSDENEIEPSTANLSKENDDVNFVWDLYYVKERLEANENNYETISITPFNNFYYHNDDNFNDTDDDSEDSNNEAHWRNDYPDTDDGLSVDSIDEEDMRRAVEDLNLGSDNLSSDDENACNFSEDPVVHFMNESVENEYNYFKKHGRRKNHGAFYRTNIQNRRNNVDDDDSEIDDDRSSDESDNSASSVSPLISCDESDND